MKLHSQRGFRNVLLRKVKQHSTFATLFSTAAAHYAQRETRRGLYPTPPSGKSIVQATLGMPILADDIAQLPAVPAWTEDLPGMAVPMTVSRVEASSPAGNLDSTEIGSVEPTLPLKYQKPLPTGEKPQGKKPSAWRKLTAAFQPKVDLPKSSAVEVPPRSHHAPAVIQPSSTLQPKPAGSSSSQQPTQAPRPTAAEPSRSPAIAHADKPGLSADDWKVLQAIHRKHQEKARQETAGEAVQESPAQSISQVPTAPPPQPTAPPLQPEEIPDQKPVDEHGRAAIREVSSSKLAKPILRGLQNIFRKENANAQQPAIAQFALRKKQEIPPRPLPTPAEPEGKKYAQLKPAGETPLLKTNPTDDLGRPGTLPPEAIGYPAPLGKAQTRQQEHIGEIPERNPTREANTHFPPPAPPLFK